MSVKNYDKLWKFITDHHSAIVVPPHLKCTWCHKLIRNSRKTPCDCKFCAPCIREYLEDGIKSCCGKKTKCNGLKLNLNKDIHGDYDTNLEIGNLVIKCPRPQCPFFGDIWTVCEHSSRCTASLDPRSRDPGLQWGCEIADGFRSYYDIMVEANTLEINNMKETLTNLARGDSSLELESILRENQSQADTIRTLVELTSKMGLELNDLKSTRKKQNVEIDRLNKSNASLRKSLGEVVSGLRDMKNKSQTLVDERVVVALEPLRQGLEAVTLKVATLEEYMGQAGRRLDRMTEVDTTFSLALKSLREDVSLLQDKYEEIFFSIGGLACKLDNVQDSVIQDLGIQALHRENAAAPDGGDLEPSSVCMFSWTVNNFSSYKTEASQRKNRKLTSKDFHASDHSYKIHFDLYPLGYGDGNRQFLSLFAVIKKSHEREWTGALSYDITVSIMANGRRHHTHKLGQIAATKVAGAAAQSDVDHCVGIERLVEVDAIFGDPPLLDGANSLTFEFLVKKKKVNNP